MLRAYRQMRFIACYMHLCMELHKNQGSNSLFLSPSSISKNTQGTSTHNPIQASLSVCFNLRGNYHDFTNLMQTHRKATKMGP